MKPTKMKMCRRPGIGSSSIRFCAKHRRAVSWTAPGMSGEAALLVRLRLEQRVEPVATYPREPRERGHEERDHQESRSVETSAVARG